MPVTVRGVNLENMELKYSDVITWRSLFKVAENYSTIDELYEDMKLKYPQLNLSGLGFYHLMLTCFWYEKNIDESGVQVYKLEVKSKDERTNTTTE